MLLATTVLAVSAYIRPPFIEIEGAAKRNVLNVIPGWVEVKNVNAVPVTVNLATGLNAEFDDNNFILAPGELRVINFSIIVTTYGGYSSYIDATYRKTTGGLPTTVTAIMEVIAAANGTGINTHAPSAPVITAPANDTVIDDVLYIQWTPSTDADGNTILYYVIIDDNSNFLSPEYNISTLKTRKIINLEPGRIYFWKVIAYDGKFSTSSVPGTGMTSNELPPIPSLISPSNGAVLNIGPILSWSSVVDPDGDTVRYDILVDNNPDFSSSEISTTQLGTLLNTASMLGEGTQYWKVRSRDSVGTSDFSSTRSFSLDCLDPYCYNLVVTSPIGDMQNTKTLWFNFTINKNAKYIDKALNSKYFSRICSDCDSVAKKYTAIEGFNNFTIKITGYNGEIYYHSIYFIVDSTKPAIYTTTPKDKSWIGGTSFSVKYTEYNLQNISLFYGNGTMNEVMLNNCPNGRNVVCSIDLHLDEYDGMQIKYYFTIRDTFKSVNSKNYTLYIDATYPVINLISPLNTTYSSTVTRITVNVTEKVSLKYRDNGKTPITLCTSCNFYNSSRSFSKGFHNLVINATDKAGNSVIKSVNFTIGSINILNILGTDTTPPVINLMSPLNQTYTNNYVRVTVNLTEKATLKYSDNGATPITLCTYCNYYNVMKYFRDGFHNLVINATDKAGNSVLSPVSFTII